MGTNDVIVLLKRIRDIKKRFVILDPEVDRLNEFIYYPFRNSTYYLHSGALDILQ